MIEDEMALAVKRAWVLRDLRNECEGAVGEALVRHSELEELAFAKVRTLNVIESWVFAFSPSEIGIVPRYPQYWSYTLQPAHEGTSG